MAQETQDNSQNLVITHGSDGWTYQQYDIIPEENAIIYKCGGCGKLIKVQEVQYEEPTDVQGKPEEKPPELQEQTKEQTTNTEVAQPQQNQKRRKNKKQSKVELPSHAV